LLRKELLLNLKFEHVKGNQDLGTPTALTQLASMNVEMDTVAKRKTNQQGGHWTHEI